MALNITINKVAVAASFAAGATVATVVASGGTTPYVYSLATGNDEFAINSSTGIVTTIAVMDINNISPFSVTAIDSTTGIALTVTSGVIYPPMQAKVQSKFNKPNIIYKITKDIDLGNGVLTIPEGCTLDFQGGSFNNGTINCNGTVIVGKFGGNATITGTYTYQDAQADEEDITQNQLSVLKFKDKAYEPDNYSGLGRIYLRKNIVENKNVLTQDMINKPNTIYEIRYDFDLNAEDINLPENCILKIVGGSFSNGTLTGQKTTINAKNIIIFKNIIILGTWIVTDIYQSWFDFDLNELANNRNNFKNIIQLTNVDITNNVYFNDGIYYTKVYDKEDSNVEALFLLNSNTNLYLNNCVIKTIPFKYTHKNIIIVKNANNINIYGGRLVGDADTHDYDTTISGTHEFSHGIKIGTNSRNININNTIIEKFTGDGIDLIESGENAINNVQITNVVCDSNNRQGISIESGKNIFIKNSKFINTSSIHVTAPSAGLDIEPWTKGVYVENIHIENCVFENNKGGIIIQPNVQEDDKVYNENNISINKSIVDASISIDCCNTIKINEIKNATYIKITQTKNIDINNTNTNILETYRNLENLSLTKCCIANRVLISENDNNDNVKITDCDINRLNIEFIKNIKINNSIINSFGQYRNAKHTFIKDSKIKAFTYLSGTVELLNNDIQFENTNNIFLTGEIVRNIISCNNNAAISIGNAVIKQNLIINKNERETLFTLKQADGIYELIDNQIQGFKYLCSLDLMPKKVKIYLNSPIILCKNNIDPNTIEATDGCLDIKDGITRIYREGNWYSLNLTNPNAIERPTTKFSGQSFFDKSLNCPIWWNGNKWIDSNGHEAHVNKGSSSNRPTLSTKDVGFQYYDTALKKYIVWNGTEWANMDGTPLT